MIIKIKLLSSFKRTFHIFYLIYLLFILSLLVINSINCSVILTCCPNNLQLTKMINGAETHRMDKYFCSDRSIILYNINDGPFFNSSNINGINIFQSNDINIPECEMYRLTKLNENNSIQVFPKNSCISASSLNEINILHCHSSITSEDLIPSKSQESSIIVNVIRKCCPFRQIYDKSSSKCIKSEKEFNNDFNKFFKNPTILNDSQLICPEEYSVLVDYHYKYFNFDFINNNIFNVPEINENYNFNLMCIESVFDYDDIGNIIKISNEYWDHQPKFSFMIRTCNKPKICDKFPCIRRCCQQNQKFVKINKTSCLTDLSYSDIQLSFHANDNNFTVMEPKAYGTLFGQDCRMYKLDPTTPYDEHYIDYKDGSLHLPNDELTKLVDNNKYCIEKLENRSGRQQLGTFLCFHQTESNEVKFRVYSIGILISCVFFILTLLVYLFVPKLRNLPGKILICLVTCLLIAYMGIGIGQMAPPEDDKVCYSFAFFIYFSMMAAFSWMNIMCFDIWLTFGSTMRPRGNFGNQELKRFLMYSLYGWGMPTLITSMTIFVTRLNLVHDDLQPKFGEGRCWFQHAHSKPHLLFFLGPVGILFLFNLTLFILTLKYCNHVKKDIQRMQSTNADKPIIKKTFTVDRARFMMNTKLFIVMGITWFLEILSTIFYTETNQYLWYITDLSNILQGVLVFFVFVFKRRVWYAVLDRFGIKNEGGRKSTTMGTTSTYTGDSTINLHRLKSMESCSSLLATNATAINGRRLSPLTNRIK